MCENIEVANPVDEAISQMIEKLVAKHGGFFTSAEEDDKILSQIAELRASMRPIIHIHH